jgi:two-component system, OmpR family, response regulator ChvI
MKRIAVVDDEPDITTILKKALELHDFAVDTFNDPQAALANFKPSYYDLMIIDIRMPRINGFDLYRELKKRDSAVRVCFLTAFEIYYEEFRKLFPTIDVKAFIRKPVSISNIVNQINAIIASK